jgi:hypothetical protein
MKSALSMNNSRLNGSFREPPSGFSGIVHGAEFFHLIGRIVRDDDLDRPKHAKRRCAVLLNSLRTACSRPRTR